MLLPLLTMTTEVTDTMEDTTYAHYRSQGTTSELIPSTKSLLPFILQVSLCFHRQPGDAGLPGVQTGGYEERQHFRLQPDSSRLVITFFSAVKINLM